MFLPKSELECLAEMPAARLRGRQAERPPHLAEKQEARPLDPVLLGCFGVLGPSWLLAVNPLSAFLALK